MLCKNTTILEGLDCGMILLCCPVHMNDYKCIHILLNAVFYHSQWISSSKKLVVRKGCA